MVRPTLLLLLLVACDRPLKAGPGDLDAAWRGTESGRFIAPLVATHCAESGLVELIALRGDTGIGVALFLKDSAKIDPVIYPVLPGSLLEEPRPGATVGARWFETTTIAAFEGVAGKVQLEAAGGFLAGTIDAKFQALDRPDTFRLNATFSQVQVVQADSKCKLIRKRNKM